MSGFKFEPTPIEGVKVIQPLIIKDERGFFSKNLEQELFREEGITFSVYESIESYSYKGVLRGLHFQLGAPQAKLIRAVQGEIFDVAVDLRTGSPTFGMWYGINLSDENMKMLYIPKGFAHGYLALSDTARVCYFADDRYAPELERGIIWNDKQLGIKWPEELKNEYVISQKDKLLPTLSDFIQNLERNL